MVYLITNVIRVNVNIIQIAIKRVYDIPTAQNVKKKEQYIQCIIKKMENAEIKRNIYGKYYKSYTHDSNGNCIYSINGNGNSSINRVNNTYKHVNVLQTSFTYFLI